MKALTLHNPWATLMASGHKTTETRNWYTHYRGPIAIHAGKFTREQRGISTQSPYLLLLREAGFKSVFDLPSGSIVAIGQLTACERITAQMYQHAKASNPVDFVLGDWTPGRYAWRFELEHCLLDDDALIPTRGYQGLWDWDPPSELFGLRDEVPA